MIELQHATPSERDRYVAGIERLVKVAKDRRAPKMAEFLSRRADAAVTHYRAEKFFTPQGDVTFWVPRDQTPLQTITVLLECYERAMRRSA